MSVAARTVVASKRRWRLFVRTGFHPRARAASRCGGVVFLQLSTNHTYRLRTRAPSPPIAVNSGSSTKMTGSLEVRPQKTPGQCWFHVSRSSSADPRRTKIVRNDWYFGVGDFREVLRTRGRRWNRLRIYDVDGDRPAKRSTEGNNDNEAFCNDNQPVLPSACPPY